MILNYHFDQYCHDPDTLKYQIIHEFEKCNDLIVNIFAAEEFAVGWSCDDIEKLDNCQINYLLCSLDIEWYQNPFFGNSFMSPNRSVELWPTFFFKKTYYNQTLNLDLFKFDHSTFKYPLMCLNKKGHKHRIDLLNEFRNHNLIEGNAVSWLEELSTSFGKLTSNVSKLTLTEPGVYFSETRIPLEWHQSFLHVVAESVVHVRFITEKTVKCLLGQNLFVAWAAPKFHQGLLELGMVLYDDVIDYSFDTIQDDNLRLKTLVSEIDRVTSTTNYRDVYELIKPKLEHNQRRAIELAFDNSCPQMIKDYKVDYYNSFLNLTPRHIIT